MEATINHQMFRRTVARTNLPTTVLDESTTSIIPYAETMLCEYYNLVNSLTKLTQVQLKSIAHEMNQVLDNLLTWQNNAISINAAELFYAMLQLKQKSNRMATQNTQKSSMLNIKYHKETTRSYLESSQ